MRRKSGPPSAELTLKLWFDWLEACPEAFGRPPPGRMWRLRTKSNWKLTVTSRTVANYHTCKHSCFIFAFVKFKNTTFWMSCCSVSASVALHVNSAVCWCTDLPCVCVCVCLSQSGQAWIYDSWAHSRTFMDFSWRAAVGFHKSVCYSLHPSLLSFSSTSVLFISQGLQSLKSKLPLELAGILTLFYFISKSSSSFHASGKKIKVQLGQLLRDFFQLCKAVIVYIIM